MGTSRALPCVSLPRTRCECQFNSGVTVRGVTWLTVDEDEVLSMVTEVDQRLSVVVLLDAAGFAFLWCRAFARQPGCPACLTDCARRPRLTKCVVYLVAQLRCLACSVDALSTA